MFEMQNSNLDWALGANTESHVRMQIMPNISIAMIQPQINTLRCLDFQQISWFRKQIHSVCLHVCLCKQCKWSTSAKNNICFLQNVQCTNAHALQSNECVCYCLIRLKCLLIEVDLSLGRKTEVSVRIWCFHDVMWLNVHVFSKVETLIKPNVLTYIYHLLNYSI